MSEDSTQDLVAVLFNNPSSSNSASSTPLDPSIVDKFLQCIRTIQDRATDFDDSGTSQVRHTFRTLTSGEEPHRTAIIFQSPMQLAQLRNHSAILDFETTHSLQAHIQTAHTFNTPKRLAVFDMDSTLIQQEVIDLLAAHAGVEAQVSSITARAMNGELDFSASLRDRVGLLKGLPADVFETLKPSVTLTPGAETLLRCLKKMGVTTALLSGGFVPLARYIGDKLGIDHVHANELEVNHHTNTLTGELAPSCIIVDGARKKHLLESIAADMGITDSAAIMAVGDGANDLPMLWAAGLGVAVNAKPRVQRDAPGRLNGEMALQDLLFLLGKSDVEVEEMGR